MHIVVENERSKSIGAVNSRVVGNLKFNNVLVPVALVKVHKSMDHFFYSLVQEIVFSISL